MPAKGASSVSPDRRQQPQLAASSAMDDSASFWEASVKRRIASFFHFEQRRTTFTKEIRGGCVTFLTMCYILLVNPQVVSDWMGGDNEALFPDERAALSNSVASGTAVSCGVGSMLMGVAANMPFAVGPGMSMNSVFAGTIPMALNQTQLVTSQKHWNIAVTSSLFGGVAVLILATVGLAPRVLKALPDYLKAAIRVGIGLFQCFLALRTLKIIQSEPTELLKFVDHFNFADRGEDGPVAQILFGVTLFLTSSLYVCGVQAPILVSIVITTAICWICSVGGVHVPSVPFHTPVLDKSLWNFDFDAYFHDFASIGVSLSYAIITLFDVGGAMFAILTIIHEADELAHRDTDVSGSPTSAADNTARRQEADDDEAACDEAAEDTDGLLRRPQRVDTNEDALANVRATMVSESDAQRVYMVVGVSTVLSSIVGCSPTVVFLECLAGVASGARTGFSSVVTGLLFFVSLPLGPVFHNVPACAAVPALVLIGCFMILSVGEIPWHDSKRAFAAFATIILMPFTASITPGIIAGLITHFALGGVHTLGMYWKHRRGGDVHRPARFEDGELVA